MFNKFSRMLKDERGVTALETAIILIAFVVVAAVFAFTILSTGTFLTEKSKEAAYAGLETVRGSMQLTGGVVLETSGEVIVFNLSTVAGGSSVDLTKIRITYRDITTNQDLTYSSGTSPGNDAWTVTTPDGAVKTILATGELAKFRVKPLSPVTVNETFALEIKPQTGAVILLERTAPALITAVTDLH